MTAFTENLQVTGSFDSSSQIQTLREIAINSQNPFLENASLSANELIIQTNNLALCLDHMSTKEQLTDLHSKVSLDWNGPFLKILTELDAKVRVVALNESGTSAIYQALIPVEGNNGTVYVQVLFSPNSNEDLCQAVVSTSVYSNFEGKNNFKIDEFRKQLNETISKTKTDEQLQDLSNKNF